MSTTRVLRREKYSAGILLSDANSHGCTPYTTSFLDKWAARKFLCFYATRKVSSAKELRFSHHDPPLQSSNSKIDQYENTFYFPERRVDFRSLWTVWPNGTRSGDENGSCAVILPQYRSKRGGIIVALARRTDEMITASVVSVPSVDQLNSIVSTHFAPDLACPFQALILASKPFPFFCCKS